LLVRTAGIGHDQQGTTAEGVYLGTMAGAVDLMPRVSTGIEAMGNVLHLTRDTLTVRGREPGIAPIRLAVKGEVHELAGGSTRVFKLGDAGR
jgi:hypothetical protein